MTMRLSFACIVLGCAALRGEDFQGSTHQVPFEEEPISYSKQTPKDPIAQLQARLDAGTLKLKFDHDHGYLPALLEVLKVPKSSQMLVFSKTSLQRNLISPKTPRAIYFNDDVYIGYIPGAPLLELSAVDPQLGGVFYHLEQMPMRRPKFERNADCLRCHGAARTLGVPGHFVRSIATDETGELDTQSEVSPVTHFTPLADRWAGWYVTGKHGAQTHRGNLIGTAAFARHEKEPNFLGNLTELSGFFDVKQHPATGSDIVALMVLEHQAHMHNYLTRLRMETQIMVAQYGHIRYLEKKVDALLRYLLFADEVALTEPVSGNPEFVREFTSQAVRDTRGRSLRELDLQTRLFKYPCSYLIYSPAFDALPEVMRARIYERLWAILQGTDAAPAFARIEPEMRRTILDILRETKGGLPGCWTAGEAR